MDGPLRKKTLATWASSRLIAMKPTAPSGEIDALSPLRHLRQCDDVWIRASATRTHALDIVELHRRYTVGRDFIQATFARDAD